MEKTVLEEIIYRQGAQRDRLLPILQDVVEQQNFLTEGDMLHIANLLQMSAAEVYGTASFYSFLPLNRKGKYMIRLCKSIIAKMKGSDQVLAAITDQLGIKPGETTADGVFSLELVNDIGWSDREPAMLINDKVFTDLDPVKVTHILTNYLKQASTQAFVTNLSTN
ncbi:MAG: NAD(P)H-dependent oxidoreductase subunit E [Bacteroidales bacterium]|nr:NAD(P)H-dependent oxidoreductase subunit E [Bacteroidales bacterium]